MSALRIVIADDEQLARQRLQRLLERRSDCRLVGAFEDGAGLVAALPDLAADCVLLDINMPGDDGFATLAALPGRRPLVVFVTAFAEFAARAYDVDAVDYLLKPVAAARLDAALDRVARRLERPSQAVSLPPTVCFVVQGRTYLFDPARLISVQALGNYVEIVSNTRSVQLRMTLTEVEARLDPGVFCRVHRSWIVARAAIAQVTSLPGARFDILLADGRHVPGGRAYASAVVAAARRAGAV